MNFFNRQIMPWVRNVLGGFFAGLAFLAPVILTLIVLSWFLGQVVDFVGPNSLFGRALTVGGLLFAGTSRDPLLGFLIGSILLCALITGFGFAIRTRARSLMEEAVDGMLGRIPLLGPVYRPVAQLVRGMGGDRTGQMANMQACRIIFGGGVETVAFLASSKLFDIGGGPSRLVLIPTAPVPIGGALLLIEVSKVHPIPSMKFDDVAKLYLTMGVTTPPQLMVAPVPPDMSPDTILNEVSPEEGEGSDEDQNSRQ